MPPRPRWWRRCDGGRRAAGRRARRAAVAPAGSREAGIDYVGLRALGTPPEGREAARRHDQARLAAVHAGQLALPEALAQLARLRAFAVGQPVG